MAAARRQDRHGRHAEADDAEELDEPSPAEARLAAAVRALRHDAARLQAFVDAEQRERPALALVVMRELGLWRARELGLSLPDMGAEGGTLPEPLSRAIQEERPRGRPLDDDTRQRLLSRFPREVLERVRVHTGATALTRALGAHAFTSGRDIFLSGGAGNLAVLAHEVEHARQQQLAEEAPRAVGPAHGDAEAAASNVALWGNLSQRHFDASMVQRLVGFEAELTVPTYGDAKLPLTEDLNKNPVPEEAAKFLYGGVNYKQQMGVAIDYTVTADHDMHISGPGDSARARLVKAGIVPPAPKDYQGFSILEFQADPIDEMEPGSTTKYREQIERIVGHAQKLVTPKWTRIPRCTGYFTGIPDAELKSWLGKDYALIEKDIEQLAAAITDRFSLQATVGVIPSGIVDLHHLQTPEDLDAAEKIGKLTPVILSTVDTMVKSMMEKLAEKEFMKTLQKKEDGIGFEAFHGLLHLTQAYVIGNAINQTSAILTSPKNAVSFLAKMPLGDIHQKTLPEWLDKHQSDPEYVKIVDVVSNVIGGHKTATVEFWLETFTELKDMRSSDPEKGRKPFLFQEPKTFARGMLTGNIKLDSAGPTPLGPDPISKTATKHKELEKSVHGQKGVPLEIRSAGVVNSDSIFARVMEIVRQVRDINTKHMKAKDREKLLKDADT